MEFLLNELSIHEQFGSTADFAAAVSSVMDIRRAIKGAGRELYCNREIAGCRVSPGMIMQEAVRGLDLDNQRAWMSWVTKGGPFWMEQREHSDDEWLEVDGEIVTDSAVGEAAYCVAQDLPRQLISFSPSQWERNPIDVIWSRSSGVQEPVAVRNHWRVESILAELENLPVPFQSWQSLEEHIRRSTSELVLTNDFMKMKGYPYVKSVAEGIYMLVQVLNKLAMNVDEMGNRNATYQVLYDTYFMGANPYFTDESQTNKNKFNRALTFVLGADQSLFCPWHGKVNTPNNFPPVRVHFAWPMNGKEKIILPYVGKKITM